MNVRKNLLWLTSIIGLCQTFEFTPYHFNYSTFEKIAFALYENVKFMSDRVEQLNFDAAFGLTLAQANLAAVSSTQNIKFISNNESNYIIQSEQLCNNTRIYSTNQMLKNKNYPFRELIKLIIWPEIWMDKISWRKVMLQPIFSSNRNLTTRNVISSIFFGTPQEYESNFCLQQLTNDNCQVSDACADMLIRDDESQGYPLTHRLLFIKIALAVNCTENPKANFSILIEKYCQDILQNLIDLKNANFPSISRDLAMEQIALCGMEGFMEFINGNYANLIASWQNSYGCYSALNVNHWNKRARHKKSTNPMDYGCDSHASGVAAAALSLLIRGFVENNFIK